MNILYYNENGALCLEEINLLSFASSVKTPFYIYSSGEIRNNCRLVVEIGKGCDLFPCYALKANYNPALLALIRDEGFGADVVSGGELHFAEKCGFPPEKIVFAGVGKTRSEIERAVSSGIHSINIESESEFDLLADVLAHVKSKMNIAIRINPDIDPKTHPYISTGLQENKFGVTADLAYELYHRAHKNEWMQPAGIHVHIGSQIDSADPYRQTLDFLFRFMERLEKHGISISYIDLGGGIGINYAQQLDGEGTGRTYLKEILPALVAPFKKRKLKIAVELGRSIIGSAGLLVTRVIHIKETPVKKFVIVDAAMNNLIRPSLYQAEHQILVLKKQDARDEVVDIVGPVCESTDFLARNRNLPALSSGDLIAVSGAGAYGQALASNYNLRPTITEYLVNADRVDTIFGGEDIESLTARYNW